MQKPRNIAARAGRWSAQHRKTAIWGWLAFVIVALFIGSAVGTKTLDYDESGVGESGRGSETLAEAFPDNSSETVLVQSQGATAPQPSFRAAVAEVERRLAALPQAQKIEGPYAPGNQGQISPDGHSALITFKIPGSSDLAEKRVDAPLAAVAAAQRANPGFVIEEFGEASADKELSKAFEDDFRKAEITSLPITLVILVVAFGALVAAGVPLILALTAVAATIGLVGLVSQIWPVDEAISSVVLLIGLAVGVDYSMFYLRREREERAAGNSARASLEAAAATSGRAVLISGFTVMIAMAGMYLAGAATFQSFATGTIIVVAVAMVGSLTVLPAILAWLGDRVEKGHVPFIRQIKRSTAEAGLWARIVDRVLRHPVISTVSATALLLFMAIPALGLHTAVSGVETLPQDLNVIKTYNRIQEAFPGGPIPAEVVISAEDVEAPQVKQAIVELQRQAASSPQFEQPITTDVNPDRTVAQVDIPVAGDGTDSLSNRALTELRSNLIPATIGQVPGASADVTGYTAESRDFNDTMKSNAPLGLRLRPLGGLPAAAGHLPLDRDPAEGDHPQPALGGGRLRGRRLDLPGGASRVPARLRVQRGDHLVAAAVPVRRPLRPLDGLPRVHPHPHPRGLRSGPLDRGRHLPRDQDDGGGRDQRRGGDGGGVRGLRHPLPCSSSRRWGSAWRWRC